MSGSEQHYQQAALIGGFGRPVPGEDPRKAVVLWRRLEWTEPRESSAEAIGYKRNIYRLINPPAGMDRDRIDKLWDLFERQLPSAIKRLARRCQTTDDEITLVNYIATAGVRHHNFGAAINLWRRGRGELPMIGDAVQVERLGVLVDSLKMMRGFRYRVVHSPSHAQRFLLNDLGFTTMASGDNPTARIQEPGGGLFVPLNSRVALLAWIDPVRAGGFEHLILRPSWARLLNAGTWQTAPGYVVGHPDDRSLLTALKTSAEVETLLDIAGPYSGRAHGFFEDA